MQIYKATSILFMKVKVGGVLRPIAFNPCYGGGSMYVTDDKEVQKALESHPWFGDSFWATVEQPKQEEVIQEVAQEQEVVEQESAPCEPTQAEVTEVLVSSVIEARDYLRENGVTKGLRSKDDIISAGQALGVTFIGI